MLFQCLKNQIEVPKKQFVINMFNAKVTKIYNIINILLEYNCHLNSMDHEIAIDLGL